MSTQSGSGSSGNFKSLASKTVTKSSQPSSVALFLLIDWNYLEQLNNIQIERKTYLSYCIATPSIPVVGGLVFSRVLKITDDSEEMDSDEAARLIEVGFCNLLAC